MVIEKNTTKICRGKLPGGLTKNVVLGCYIVYYSFQSLLIIDFLMFIKKIITFCYSGYVL